MPPETVLGEIHVHLDEMLERRGLTLAELARRVGISDVNLGKLKNGRAAAIRWSTLGALCFELQCQPGDLLSFTPAPADRPAT
jgi:putative transcriptional regulator